MEELLIKIKSRLKKIYKDNYNEEWIVSISSLIEKYGAMSKNNIDALSEKNVYLITYGDAIHEKGKSSLSVLNKFLNENLENEITDIHILPMFEYTSDDGFSVVDYKEINKELGDWDNLRELSKSFRLMYDFVANHISKSSKWFTNFLNGDKKYKNFFIEEDKNFDTKNVIRPRTLPLFHSYKKRDGNEVSVWTTFSEDQIDLNFRNFEVLLESIDIILFYASKCASSIRLDAIGFIWKESSTTCMHLNETHEIIKLWRDIADYLFPNLQIITETNVPHKENISYFGNNDEANMVYQFALPPLVLHTYSVNNARKLSKWANEINSVAKQSTYFNFLSSHDGIGVRPVEEILTKDEIDYLANKVIKNGGRVSYKNNSDGSKSIYELNINYQDALLNEDETDENLQIQKIISAHSILLSVIGIPALYYHSLLGSRNDYKGLEESGINRRINREKLEYSFIKKELITNNRRIQIFKRLKELINIRKSIKAFYPYGKQKVLNYGENVFVIERSYEDSKIICITNVTNKNITIEMLENGFDLITKKEINNKTIINPYQVLWIVKNKI